MVGEGDNLSVFTLRPRRSFLTRCTCACVTRRLVCVYVCLCACVFLLWWDCSAVTRFDPHFSLRWQGALNNPAAVCCRMQVYVCVSVCVLVCCYMCVVQYGPLSCFLCLWETLSVSSVPIKTENKPAVETEPSVWLDPCRFKVRAHLSGGGLCSLVFLD